ncbi:LysR family transcriptional regulator [Legionella fallonii]
MLLTPEGEQLHRYCQQVSEMGGTVLASIQGAGVVSNIRIKIAGPTSMMRSRVIPHCQAVMNELPKLHLSFLIDDGFDISHQLKSGAFDVAILRPEQITPEMDSKPLLPEHYLLVCSSKWKHRTLLDIISNEKIIDFDQEDQMTFSYLKKYDLLHAIQPERHFVNNTESIAQLFIAELGYGVLSQEFAERYIQSGELHVINENKAYLSHSSLAWYPRPEQPHYFAAILHAIR